MAWKLKRWELYFLLSIFAFSIAIRLLPKLYVDSHLPAFQGDVWYRICMSQYVVDNWALPEPDIRYLPYGVVPMWYPPLSVTFLTVLSKMTTLDIPTVVTRIIPFFEAVTPLSIYFLARHLYQEKVAVYSTLILCATPSFVYWTGIADPQSLVLFLIPLYILYFLKYSRGEYGNKSLILAGIVLGFTFLFHLSYFILLLSLFMGLLFLFSKRIFKRALFAFIVLVLISQIVAVWWWYPRNLYWWWIHGLVSSSGYYTALEHFLEFGAVPAVLGGLGLAYLGIKRDKHFLFLLLWILPLFLETQNETILHAVGRIDLTWETLAKPLEGFRFYCFLAQPVSIAGGVFILFISKKVSPKLVFLFVILLAGNLVMFDIGSHLTNAGMTKKEYDAAVWYREHSDKDSLMVADYYRGQMIAGVCGGKALIGGLFPLRNVDYPYIKAPGQVQKDLYALYTTEDLEEALQIIERYKITHVFYSKNLEQTGYFGTSLQDGFGLPVYLGKFYTENFAVVYKDENILIFKVCK